MEPIGGQTSKLSSSSSKFSSSGQKCERALAFKIEDVRPWGVEQKFSAAFADVSTTRSFLYACQACGDAHALGCSVALGRNFRDSSLERRVDTLANYNERSRWCAVECEHLCCWFWDHFTSPCHGFHRRVVHI